MFVTTYQNYINKNNKTSTQILTDIILRKSNDLIYIIYYTIMYMWCAFCVSRDHVENKTKKHVIYTHEHTNSLIC